MSKDDEERNDWYYWTRTKQTHYIRFRDPDDADVAIGKVKVAVPDHLYLWHVQGPCWSTYEEKGESETLEDAKIAVDKRVMAIIEVEFKEEYIPPC